MIKDANETENDYKRVENEKETVVMKGTRRF